MDITGIIELFTLVTGVIFIVLQILQAKGMWLMNILSAAGAIAMALLSRFWANAALQTYFIVMGVVGIINWKKLGEKTPDNSVHVVPMTRKVLGTSAAIALLGGAAILWILLRTNDPSPVADAVSFILSIVAAWWLARSYKEVWFMWILADGVAVWLYASESHWGMAILYVCYVVSSVIGYIHWKRHGTVIQS